MAERAPVNLVLIVSLTLNLFAIGAGVGAGVMLWQAGQLRADAGPVGATPAGTSLWAVSGKLTPAHRTALQNYLRAMGDDLAEPIHRLRTQRRHAAQALAAEPYDAAKAERALSDAQTDADAVRGRLNAGLAKLVADFTPEERQLLAEPIEKSRIGRPADAEAASPIGAP